MNKRENYDFYCFEEMEETKQLENAAREIYKIMNKTGCNNNEIKGFVHTMVGIGLYRGEIDTALGEETE